MTASRKPRDASPGRRRRAASTTTSPSPVLIGSLVLGITVLLIIFAMGGDGAAQASTGSKPADVPVVTEPAPASRRAAPSPNAAGGRAGETPDRPAPEIAADAFTVADALYDKAAKLWNRGQDARKNGTTADYQRLLLESWDVFEELYAGLEPYTSWFEEADLEGWAMPASYTELQRHLNKWDSLRMKVKKLKPVNRR